MALVLGGRRHAPQQECITGYKAALRSGSAASADQFVLERGPA
ncbi:hypothetical protein ANO11243_067820 [Dothideomycetidae sp. 11243]|nr:hypothetical protein ANO11243_067820 [fungal sp. No.11243]